MSFEGAIHTVPHWIMCGAKGPSEEYPCRLFASDSLTAAELQYKATFQEIVYDPTPPIMIQREMFLTTWFTNFIVIDGPSWEQCFKALFKRWTPDTPKEIEP